MQLRKIQIEKSAVNKTVKITFFFKLTLTLFQTKLLNKLI